jgi:hypothetical protein
MTPLDIEAHVDAVASTLGLPLAAQHRPGVLHYFALAAAMAELVNGLVLTAHDDPAEVFSPIAPAPASPRGMARQ